MATVKQKLALEKMVEKGRAGKSISVSRIMREVGYSANTAVVPQKLTQSIGFQELCNELGLTDSFLTNALYEDIRDKPKNRERELRLAFTIKGKLDESSKTQINILVKPLATLDELKG